MLTLQVILDVIQYGVAQADEYRCTLEDGTMISGWDIGLSGLCVGDEAVITCTSRYGYGR
jgi:FKBP-type peptidyl-prolyl cis-trans isomerase